MTGALTLVGADSRTSEIEKQRLMCTSIGTDGDTGQHYSGKKKRHTVKNNVVTDKRARKIKGLSRISAGKKHDKKLADEQGLDFPPNSRLWKDTGFQGYEPLNTTTFQPKKKPKGGELTPEEKAQNAVISSARIGVEHSKSVPHCAGCVR